MWSGESSTKPCGAPLLQPLQLHACVSAVPCLSRAQPAAGISYTQRRTRQPPLPARRRRRCAGGVAPPCCVCLRAPPHLLPPLCARWAALPCSPPPAARGAPPGALRGRRLRLWRADGAPGGGLPRQTGAGHGAQGQGRHGFIRGKVRRVLSGGTRCVCVWGGGGQSRQGFTGGVAGACPLPLSPPPSGGAEEPRGTTGRAGLGRPLDGGSGGGLGGVCGGSGALRAPHPLPALQGHVSRGPARNATARPPPPAPQVSEYVKERILALRRAHPGRYGNAACVRTNAMKVGGLGGGMPGRGALQSLGRRGRSRTVACRCCLLPLAKCTQSPPPPPPNSSCRTTSGKGSWKRCSSCFQCDARCLWGTACRRGAQLTDPGDGSF